MQEESPVKKPRNSRVKPYVPAVRSGAYALVIALSTCSEDGLDGLSKHDLISLAQPYTETSFTVPSDPTKRYTAWASIKTLEKNHTVYKFGRPEKYALTDEGWTVAKKMKEVMSLNDMDTVEAVRPSASAPSRTNAGEMARMAAIRRSKQNLETPRTEAMYSDLAELPNSPRHEASSVKIPNDVLVRDLEELLRQAKSGQLNKSQFQTAVDSAYDMLEESSSIARQAEGSKPPRARSNHKDRGDIIDLTDSRQQAETFFGIEEILGDGRPMNAYIANEHTEKPASFPKPLTASSIARYEPIVVPANSYSVELIIDTREVRTRTDRDYILNELANRGIHCESRAMELGDMLWVARIHNPAIKTRLEHSDVEFPEIVLDYIIERKRLDDLEASIKDRRFTEQKFRLQRSGVSNPIYLVEDYGRVGWMPDEQHQRLVTSIAETQVINGFFLKRTRKLDETIAYLAGMTKFLRKRYQGKDISVIPSSILTPQNHISLRSPALNNVEQYITYGAFASLMSKSKVLTLRDMYLKMLMCVRGISGSKAIEIQRHWETPHTFVKALRNLRESAGRFNQHSDKEAVAPTPQGLVWSVAGDLVGKRKIGRAVSATVGEIWGLDNKPEFPN